MRRSLRGRISRRCSLVGIYDRTMLPEPVMTAIELEDFVAAAFSHAPRTYLCDAVTEAGVILRLPIGTEHGRPGGTVSGPSMMGLADAAAWLATLSRIGPVALAVTTSLNINFLRKPPIADIEAHADLIKLGKRLSVSEVRVISTATKEVVAHATVTYSIPA